MQAFIHLLNSGEDVSKYRVLAKVRPELATKRRQDRVVEELTWLDLTGFDASLGSSDRAPIVQAPGAYDSLSIDGGVELVSVDIWDTLLRRDCHPDEIKLQSARYLLIRAFGSLKPGFRDQRSVYNVRISAENASAANDEYEYRFEDAIDRWLAMVLEPSVPTNIRASLKTELLAHEFSAEKRSTRADQAVPRLLSSLKTAAIFASDFYMSARFIENLLAAHNLQHYFIRGYASSDTFDTKRSGRLFDRILSETTSEPSKVLHIGDDSCADVEMPRSKGLSAVHYFVDCESKRKAWFEASFNSWRREGPAVHHRRLAALVEDEASRHMKTGADGELEAVGARLAPLVIGYVLSIIEDAVRHRFDKVHYFTREGLFFRKVHEAIVAADPYNMRYPSAELLEVSRRSTFAASLKDCSPSSLMRLWSLYSKQSPQGLAASLNFDEDEVEAIASKFDLEFRKDIVYPWRNKKFLSFLECQAFQALAKEGIARQRRELLSYLRYKGVADASALMIADIGWRGTIQDNLAHLLPETYFVGHYLGLFGFLNAQRSNVRKSGWVFDEPAGFRSELGDIAPLEMIFNGPGGSVVGYSTDETVTAPRTVTFAGEEEIINGPVAKLQAGLLAAVAPTIDYIRLHGLMASDIKQLGTLLARSLSKRPPSAVADTFQRLRHNETFGTGAVVEMSSGDGLLTVLSAQGGSALHAEASKAIASQRWPEGALRTSEIEAWWRSAPYSLRRSLPMVMAEVYAPASIKARGSKLAIYAPPPIPASGGHRTIFNMVRRLGKLGFEPVVFLEGVGAGVPVVEEYLAETDATVHTRWHSFVPSDVAFATIAHSAQFVAGLRNAHFRGYLVQDFEAVFNPMSDGFVLAENSYAQGLQHFTIGNWLTHVINTRYAAASTPSGLGVDTKVYRPLNTDEEEAERELAVCFLYQPDKPRRTPFLGSEALRLVKMAMPEVKIYVFGSNLPLKLDFEVENLGLIKNLEELNALYNRCMVGLCISGSNPSRIPYEMMAAGCVPVDLYRYNNLLDHKRGTALLAYQNADSLAQAMLELLSDPDKARGMAKAAQTFVSSRTLDWELDVIANNVLALMDGELPPLSEIDLFYDDEPIISATKGDEQAMRRFCDAQRAAALQPGWR